MFLTNLGKYIRNYEFHSSVGLWAIIYEFQSFYYVYIQGDKPISGTVEIALTNLGKYIRNYEFHSSVGLWAIIYEFQSFYYVYIQGDKPISGTVEIAFNNGFKINIPSNILGLTIYPLTDSQGKASQQVKVYTDKIVCLNANLTTTIFGGGFIPKIN